MSDDTLFKLVFLIGLIVSEAIRAPHRRRNREDRKQRRIVDQRIRGAELIVLYCGLVSMYILPIVYIFTSWLDFADYDLPSWAGFVGIATLALAVWLLWRAHADLGRNWSAALEISRDHTLVTEGIYRHIRHPIYASMLVTGVAQALLLHNWIGGLSNLAQFALVYGLRVPREEQMMLERFGDAYRAYMQRTGRIIPRLG